jgi:hypothetical protein
MHIVIPYAAPNGESIQQALTQVQAPSLMALLKRLDATAVWSGNPADLTPLHERVLADTLWTGHQPADGLIPWAAADALQHPNRGANCAHTAASAWARLTLCHWVIHADHVEMADPAQLQVTPEESCALKDAMRQYFAEDGITLHMAEDGSWLAEGEVFRGLPTASLDRVRGTRVDAWIPRQPQAKPLRRLQNEMQMLLYTHPVNDARSARGLPAINAFWVSATGELPTETVANGTSAHVARTGFDPKSASLSKAPQIATCAAQVHDDLRAAGLRDDASAWLKAWRVLDTGPIARLLQIATHGDAATRPENSLMTPLALTLCGDHTARTLALQPRTLWTRLSRQFLTPDLPRLLKSL